MATKKTTTKPENEQPYMSDGEAEAIAIKAREQEEAERLAKQRADGDDPDYGSTLELEQERDKLRAELNAATQAFEACSMERDSALKAEEAALMKRDAAIQGLDAARELLESVVRIKALSFLGALPKGWVEGVKEWKQAYDKVGNRNYLPSEKTMRGSATKKSPAPKVKTPPVSHYKKVESGSFVAPGMGLVPGFVKRQLGKGVL